MWTLTVLSQGAPEMERARARQTRSLGNPTHHGHKAHHSCAAHKQKMKPDPARARQPVLGQFSGHPSAAIQETHSGSYFSLSRK